MSRASKGEHSPMMLNRDQIVQNGLISAGFQLEALHEAGYDLTIATVIGRSEDGTVSSHSDDFDLEPQGIAAVVSKETVALPADNLLFQGRRKCEGVLSSTRAFSPTTLPSHSGLHLATFRRKNAMRNP
jgi:hypothetical protein